MSEGDDAAFAAIVRRLRDPERRRLRLASLAVGLAVIVIVVAVSVLVLGSWWAAVASFVLTFAVGLAVGTFFVGRHRRRHGL